MPLDLPAAVPPEPLGEAIALDVVYEDDDLIVIDKPAGLVVHPAAGHETGTLVNALIAHCGDSLSGIGGVKRPGIVHRLDKDTSGLLVVAKTDRAHQSLAEQFADHGRTGPAGAGLLRARLGRARSAARHHRGGARPRVRRTARRWPWSRDERGPLRHHPLRGRGAARRSGAEPIGEPRRAASSRPGARTRSACIWPISATRFSATRLYGSGFKTKANRLSESRSRR